MRKKKIFNGFDIFVTITTVLFALICLYPMWYVFLVSITSYDEYVGRDFIFLPPLRPTFEYYKYIFSSASNLYTRAMMVSFLKTASGSVIALIVTAMMAYGVSKKKIKGMKTINFMMVFTMFFSGGLIPLYLLIKDLRLLGTFWVMVFPYMINIGHFIIMRNYFSYAVTPSLEDAALIDGANEAIMFIRIVIPISAPMMAAIFLFEAVFHWNDYYSYLIFVDEVRLQPFVWVLRRILTSMSILTTMGASEYSIAEGVGFMPPESLKMATIVIAMLPIIMLYPFLQKHFAKGILIGAVKE